MRLPTGTVTFLFTDIEGSTRLWEAHPDAMREALAAHDAIFREVVPACGGVIFKTVGDAICAAYERADDAVRAAVAAQRRLIAQPWPAEIGAILVRMGIHTGTAQERDDDYFGRSVNRVARFMSIAHGGQILVSGATAALLRNLELDGVSLRDLGEHRLKDLSEPEPAFQVLADGLTIAFPSLASLDAHPNNLPSQTSSFVGRTGELAALAAAMRNHRLVTLTGPGGIGKTRLSLQFAADAVHGFKDGVWFVEFAGVEDRALILQSVVNALRVREVAQESLSQTLARALERKQLLLILDNAEHLLTDIAGMAASLLANAPGLRVLVTSREPLHLDGEFVLRLHPLRLPFETNAGVTAGEAVELFLERAGNARPDLPVRSADIEHVTSICTRLEGIPLAIELAAARVATLSFAELDERLERRFRILVSRDQTKAARHRTLWETIDWSYRLLEPEERRFAAELAIFNGSFTLEGCEAILPHGDATLDLLDSMVSKSIVTVLATRHGTRYSIYDALREYLSEIMGTSTLLHQRHLAYFADIAAAGHDHASAERHGAWLDRVGMEMAELRAAFLWSFECARERGVRMLFDVCRYWDIRNQYAEGLEWLRRALALDDLPPKIRAALLRRAAVFAAVRLEHVNANRLTSECLAAYEALDDVAGSGQALLDLAVIAHRVGDEATAAEHYWLALERLRRGGDAAGEARALLNLTLLAFGNDDFISAESLLEKAAACATEVGDAHLTAHITGFRASLEFRRGNTAAALELNREALEVRRAIDNPFGIAETLDRMAAIHVRRGDMAEARDAARECLIIALTISSPPLIIDAFEAFCEIALREGSLDDAARYFTAAGYLRGLHQYRPGTLRNVEGMEEKLRHQLGAGYASYVESAHMRWRHEAATLSLGPPPAVSQP